MLNRYYFAASGAFDFACCAMTPNLRLRRRQFRFLQLVSDVMRFLENGLEACELLLAFGLLYQLMYVLEGVALLFIHCSRSVCFSMFVFQWWRMMITR